MFRPIARREDVHLGSVIFPRSLPGRAETEVVTRIVARPGALAPLQQWVREHGTLAAAAWAHPGVDTFQGRGRVYVVPAPTSDSWWVVRHYHRGGALASLLGDRYLRVGKPRPFREFEIGLALEALEIPTPLHIGAAVYQAGLWRRGDLVTRLVPGSVDLAAVLFGGTGERKPSVQSAVAVDPASAMEEAGSLTRLLHERGVVHRDLNLKNILIVPQAHDAARSADGVSDRPDGSVPASGPPRALILDLDRASLRSRVGERSRRRMLNRFWRSARKWESKTGRSLDPALRRAFADGYAR